MRTKRRSETQEPRSEQNDADSSEVTSFASMTAADMLSQYKNASMEFGDAAEKAPVVDPDIGTQKLARELEEFISKGPDQGQDSYSKRGRETNFMDEEAMADLQLQTARKLRELLPTSNELLYLAQERNWLPILLSWLNLHDRPAVQMEALLALTNIAELCAQQNYYQHTHSSSSSQSSSSAAEVAEAAAAAARAAKAGSKVDGGTPSTSGSLTGPGNVQFPLSFSQTLTPEAMAAFDASLSSTIQQTKSQSGAGATKQTSASKSGGTTGTSNSTSNLLSSLTSSLSQSLQSSGLSSTLSFGLGSSSEYASGKLNPPPTPVSTSKDGSTFLPKLSPSSQHLLLRHADAIPTLISLLSSPNREVYEQAVWILGTIAAGDPGGTGSSGKDRDGERSPAARDVILAAGIMNNLLRCLDAHPTNLSLQRIGSWTLCSLVEGIFQQPSHKSGSKASSYNSSDEIKMEKLLPVLRRLLNMSDAEVLSFSCWTLSHICDGPSSHIAAVVTTTNPKAPPGGLVPRLVELLLHPSWRVTKPALRTIGNIVCAECSDDSTSSASGITDFTEVILDCAAVPRLVELVTHGNKEIQKEACWTLSNVAAGTVDQIQAVIDSGAIPPLVELVSDKNTEQEVRSEACWVVLNATSCGSDSQIELLVEEGCVSVLGVLLDEPSMVIMALEGLERVLQVEENRATTRHHKKKKFKKDDGAGSPVLVSAALIEKALDKHNSSAVTKRATRIWKQHFVSCALCNESFSKHRTNDATFCDECKCYVCAKCNCKVYHLSYQEELWADDDAKAEARKNAKKSKNKKKKQKQKNAKHQPPETQSSPTEPTMVAVDAPPCVKFTAQNESSAESKSKDEGSSTSDEVNELKEGNVNASSASFDNFPDRSGAFDDAEEDQPPIDFVLYLQETGSILALAKLMDALDYGDGSNDLGDELNDDELELFRSLHAQQQATN